MDHGIDEAEVEAHENTQTLVTVKGRKNGHQQIVDHAPQSEASDRDTLLEMDRGKLAFKVLAGKLGGERTTNVLEVPESTRTVTHAVTITTTMNSRSTIQMSLKVAQTLRVIEANKSPSFPIHLLKKY